MKETAIYTINIMADVRGAIVLLKWLFEYTDFEFCNEPEHQDEIMTAFHKKMGIEHEDVILKDVFIEKTNYLGYALGEKITPKKSIFKVVK